MIKACFVYYNRNNRNFAFGKAKETGFPEMDKIGLDFPNIYYL